MVLEQSLTQSHGSDGPDGQGSWFSWSRIMVLELESLTQGHGADGPDGLDDPADPGSWF